MLAVIAAYLIYGLTKSYNHTTTAQRAVADVAAQSHCTRCTVAAHLGDWHFEYSAKTLRSVAISVSV